MKVQREDIQSSLSHLPPDAKEPRRVRRTPRSQRPPRHIVRRLLLAVVLFAAVTIGGLGVKAFINTYHVFHGGSILSLLLPGTPLQTDEHGLTNILVFGTSQDDPSHQNAEGGGGLWLTDSIQLVSINQTTHSIHVVAVPRDLWVNLSVCGAGQYGKINAVYECGADLQNTDSHPGASYPQADAAGARRLMSTVADVTGLTPQYYVHVNYSALTQAVDAVGGIDVTIVGDGASGIYDTNFDWNCPRGPYTCKNVYYPTNGTYHLSGQQALYLARARGDAGEYSYKDFGLAQGDFDRQANQQKIMKALLSKAKSVGVLANPFALSGLLDAFGNNVSTSLSGGEIKTLLGVSSSTPASHITSISLVDPADPSVTTGSIAGQSVVIPVSGITDYTSITRYIASKLGTN